MICGEQKGPHQQVRFGLSLSVLPTAPGITPPAGPVTGPHPELCPRPGKKVCPAGEEAWPSTWHHPQDLNTHSADPSHRMVTSHGKVFLELPPDLGPSLHTLQSHSCLQSGSFWKPEDPHSDLEARTGLGSQGSPLPGRSLGLPGGAPEYTWPGGVRAAIAHFFLYQVRPSASRFLPCATEGGG